MFFLFQNVRFTSTNIFKQPLLPHQFTTHRVKQKYPTLSQSLFSEPGQEEAVASLAGEYLRLGGSLETHRLARTKICYIMFAVLVLVDQTKDLFGSRTVLFLGCRMVGWEKSS